MDIPEYNCKRCDHHWQGRKVAGLPVRCPKCGSPSWDKPRKQK